MIKTAGGTNITPSEVEAALTARADVLEAYVVAISDEDEATMVGAAVVARTGASLDGEELRVALRNNLSAYKIPKYIWVASKHELPFTDTGKIQKNALAEQLTRRYLARKEAHHDHTTV